METKAKLENMSGIEVSITPQVSGILGYLMRKFMLSYTLQVWTCGPCLLGIAEGPAYSKGMLTSGGQ